MINAELLTTISELIDATPEKLDQTSWRCGTTRCVAGWVVELTAAWVSDNMFNPGYQVVATPNRFYEVDDYAQAELGLSDSQAERLFFATNTIEDVQLAIKELLELAATDEQN